MKKIFFGGGGQGPLWGPKGAWGVIWRILVFLLLLGALLLIVSLFRHCNRGGEIPEDILHPRTDQVLVPIDTVAQYVPGMPDAGPYLPPEDDNYLRPIDPDDIRDGFVSNRLNVIINDSAAGDQAMRKWSQEFKAHYPDSSYAVCFYDNKTKLMQIQAPDSAVRPLMQNLPRQITDVKFKLFQEEVLNLAFRPNDPAFSDSRLDWMFKAIQAEDAWNVTQGKEDIVVAVVDSYFDLNHYELNSARIKKPYSVIRKTGNVAPQPGGPEESLVHGTAVASLSIGNIDNRCGASGLAPKCSFMPVSLGHQLTSMRVLEGVLYSINQGAHVVNVSIGGQYPQLANLPPEQQVNFGKTNFKDQEDVWDYVGKMANERNVTLVWAAGNEHCYAGLDPSKRDASTIVVSAVNPSLLPAEFTNYGNFPNLGVEVSTVSAPGQQIFCAVPGNTFAMMDGTSFAAPIVTGCVALMKSKNPRLTNSQIISILKQTGKPVRNGATIGKLIQIGEALKKC